MMNRNSVISTTAIWMHPCCRFGAVALFALATGALTGCNAPQADGEEMQAAQAMTEDEADELREDLKGFRYFFNSTIDQASLDLERKSDTKETRRKSIQWQKNVREQFRAVSDELDPREALLDIWVLCLRLKVYFDSGDGKTMFAPDQSIAVDATNLICDRIEQIARKHTPPKLFETALKEVTAHAQAHPIKGDFRELNVADLSDQPEGQSLLASIISVPLAPISALQGVGGTPKSIRAVSESMDRFTDVTEDLPANARRQAQLLVMNLEDTDTVKDTVGSIKQFSDSTARITQVVENMPQKTREQAEILIDRIDNSQTQIQTTLGEAQKTVELVRKATDDMKGLNTETAGTIADVGNASKAVKSAADSATVTIQEVLKFFPADRKDETGQLLGKKPPTPEEIAAMDPATGNKFSFQAITNAANALTGTTANLQRLLTELHNLLDDGTVPKQVGELQTEFTESLNLTGARIESIIDHAAVRGAELIALLFGLLIVFRLVNIRKRSPQPTPVPK